MDFKHPEASTQEVPSIQQYRRIFIYYHIYGIANALTKAESYRGAKSTFNASAADDAL
jgi:hypothetical protein